MADYAPVQPDKPNAQGTPVPSDKGFLKVIYDAIGKMLSGSPSTPPAQASGVDPANVEGTSLGAPQNATPTPTPSPTPMNTPTPTPMSASSPMAGMNPQRSLMMAKASMPQMGGGNENDKFLKKGAKKY